MAVIAGLVATSTLGCSKDLRDVIKEHRPKVEAQLAKVRSIREAARAAPRVTEDRVEMKGPAPRFTLVGHNDKDNSAIEYLEDLDNLEEYANISTRLLGSGGVNMCASALKTHREPFNPAWGSSSTPSEMSSYGAENAFERCEAMLYLFVIRSLAHAAPSATAETVPGPCPKPALDNTANTSAALDAGPGDAGPTDAGAGDAGARRGRLGSVFVPKPSNAAIQDAGADSGPMDAGSDAATPSSASALAEKCLRFEGGYLKAEVLVFDVASGALLGGFRFEAESSNLVDVNKQSPDSDFRVKMAEAFTQAAKKAIPSLLGGY